MKRAFAIALGAGTILAGASSEAAQSAGGPSLGWAALKMAISLAIVLGILLLVSRYAKRYMDRFYGTARPGRSVSIVEIQRLGPKTRILALDAYGAKYLLGVSPAGISLIDKIPAEAGTGDPR